MIEVGFCVLKNQWFVKRWFLTLFLILLLFIPQATAGCSHYLDCPEPVCPGSLRLCVSGECISTHCSFEESSTESYSKPFKPYEKALNVTLMEEEGEFRTGILAAFGINDVLSGLGMTFGVIALVVLVLLLLFFFKSKSKLILALGMALSIMIIGLLLGSFLSGENMFRRAFLFGPGDWDSQSFRDFVPEKLAEDVARTPVRVPVSRDEIVSVSSVFKKGMTYRFESQTEPPISVMILELYRAADIVDIPSSFIGELSSSETIGGEKVYFGVSGKGMKRAVWDDNRYLFIVESSSDDMMKVIEEIINRYPVRPSKSLLSIHDSYPPIIRFVSPAPNSIGSSFDIVVEIDDSLSGPDLKSISSDMEPFHPLRDCEVLVNGTVLCVWTPEFSEGLNSVALTALDKSGNSAISSIVLSIDTQRPIVTIWPEEGFVADTNKLIIEISDLIAGLNISSVNIWLNAQVLDVSKCAPATDSWVCVYKDVLLEGSNVLRFEAEDNIGNLIVLKREVVYDTHPPDIRFILDNPLTVTFEITDSGVGVSINSITLNVAGFDSTKDCHVQENTILCVYDGSWESGLTVTATDRGGLSRSAEYP